MTLPLTIFLVSGVCIALMLLVKYIQLRTGSELMFRNIRTSAEKGIGRIIEGTTPLVAKVSGKSVQRAFRIFVYVVVLVGVYMLRKVKSYVVRIAKFVYHSQETHREKGAVSFFLKHVSQDKIESESKRAF